MNATVVSCCRVAPALGDPAANRELVADAVSHAAAQGASVIVLPELVPSGYVFDSRADAQASAEAECQLDHALDKAISPISHVHDDRRPELYGRLAE